MTGSKSYHQLRADLEEVDFIVVGADVLRPAPDRFLADVRLVLSEVETDVVLAVPGVLHEWRVAATVVDERFRRLDYLACCERKGVRCTFDEGEQPMTPASGTGSSTMTPHIRPPKSSPLQ